MKEISSVINTNRLKLRICSKKDAPFILDFYRRNLDDFSKYEVIDRNAIRTLRYHESMLKAEESMTSNGSMVRYYMFEKHDPFRVIGTFAFHKIQYLHHCNATLGYKVDESMRRQGYAKEALRAGIHIAFQNLGLHRIEAIVLPDNYPSIRLLESLGFMQEGLMHDKVRINGTWQDHYLYAKINHNN